MMVNVWTNPTPRAITDTINDAGTQTKTLMKRSHVVDALKKPVVEAGREESG
jgi:hypothetical protein